MLKKLLRAMTTQKQEQRLTELYRNLIRREARIGGQLFGPIPKHGRREFFCLDEHTWIWHEEWTDEHGKHQAVTTRYDVRPAGVIKIQDGQPDRYVSLDEAQRLYQAVNLYYKRVEADLHDFIFQSSNA